MYIHMHIDLYIYIYIYAFRYILKGHYKEREEYIAQENYDNKYMKI